MKRMIRAIVLVLVVVLATAPSFAANAYEALQPNQQLHGFTVQNLYLNARDEAFGARFKHVKTGFTLDLFELQSVPQALTWVSTPIDNDMGLPHTCEHLTLGKGNKGRFVSSLESMSLVTSTAYTSQIFTLYLFNSEGGGDIFFNVLGASLDALVNPDFTDEEIRREVCHIGVDVDPNDGSLKLDEKGTIYTEMVSSFERYSYYLSRATGEMVYGKGHPLVSASGGDPAAIRLMQPRDMRDFLAKYYRLGNMGVVATIPGAITPNQFLARTDSMLVRINGGEGSSAAPSRAKLPPPASVTPPGTARIATYPGASADEPGQIAFAWPADLEYDNTERLLLSAFLNCLGGSETSNLYNILINSATRKVDINATGVYAYADDDIGHAIYMGISDVTPDHLTETELASLAAIIQQEIAAVAAYKPGSPELLAFNDRVKSRLREMQKDAEAYLNTPPGFGARNFSGEGWYDLVKTLRGKPGFQKSVLQKEERAAAMARLETPDNVWTSFIDKWHLTTTKPYMVGCKADPGILTKAAEEKKDRLDAFTAGLMRTFNVADPATAIAKYKEEFDRQTAALDAEAAKTPMPKFLDNPPLSYDPELDYQVITVGGAVPLVASTINSMTSATVGLAMNLRVIPEDKLIYVPLLPELVTEVGVVKDGKVIDYAAFNQLLKNDVQNLSGGVVGNPYSGRQELMLTGAGNNAAECKAAVEWMGAGLLHPYLETDNVARLRDLVANRLVGARNTMKGNYEEYWVQIPPMAYLFQEDKMILAASCFLTQQNLLLRLKWRLAATGNSTTDAAAIGLLEALRAAGKGQTKEALVGFAGGFAAAAAGTYASGPFAPFASSYAAASPEARKIADEALLDLAAEVPLIPEANAASDWLALTAQMKKELQYGASQTLADLKTLLPLLAQRKNARMFMVSSEKDREALMPAITALIDQFSADGVPALVSYARTPVVLERLRDRYPGLAKPPFVGLVNPNTRNGVFINSAPVANFAETDQERLLDFLSAKLYSGHGSHSMFMKTWAAGLAYSNGLRSGETDGRLLYYAERCPDLAATMGFVAEQLRQAPYSPALAEYAVAQAFSINRGSARYDSRAGSMAANLADGLTPEKITQFRRRILDLRKLPDLYDLLQKRMERVYAGVVLGYGPQPQDRSRGNYFIVAPEAQFGKLEDYLGATEGKQTVYRLYPRDFWLMN